MAEEALDESTIGEVFEDKPEGEIQNEATTEIAEKGVTGEPQETEDEPNTEPPSTADADQGQYIALQDERKRRQEAETRLAEVLKSQETVPDQYEDPQAHAAYIQRQSAEGRINGSRETVRSLKDDYSEMEAVFMGMVTDDKGNVTNQSLINQMNGASSPALFAYNTAKTYQETERYRDPAARTQYETELKEKLLKEIRAELGHKPLETVPNLTGATAAGTNTPGVIAGAETISDLFESDT